MSQPDEVVPARRVPLEADSGSSNHLCLKQLTLLQVPTPTPTLVADFVPKCRVTPFIRIHPSSKTNSAPANSTREAGKNFSKNILFMSPHNLVRRFRDLSHLVDEIRPSGDFDSDIANFVFDFGVFISQFSLNNMVDNNRTLKKLATPDVKILTSILRSLMLCVPPLRPHGILGLHQDEGIPLLFGWRSKGLVIPKTNIV
ncbi:hypothetical protein CR513_01405, partial [Mucuna pruriens]